MPLLLAVNASGLGSSEHVIEAWTSDDAMLSETPEMDAMKDV